MSTTPLTSVTGEDVTGTEINTVGDGFYSRFHAPTNYGTSSALWASLAGIAIPFHKRFNSSYVRVDITLQANATIANDELEVSVSFNNLATDPPGMAHRKFLTANVFTTVSGTGYLAPQINNFSDTGVAGAYSAMLVWRRLAGTGNIFVPGSGLPIMFKLREIVF